MQPALIPSNTTRQIITVDDIVNNAQMQLERGKATLATVTDLPQLVKVRGMTKSVHDSIGTMISDRTKRLEAQNYLAELRIRTERQIGTVLLSLPKHNGARPDDAGCTEYTPLIRDLGINKNQSSHWQRIAQLPQDEFDKVCWDAKENGWELSTRDMTNRANEYLGASNGAKVVTLRENIYLQNDGSLVMPASLYKGLAPYKNKPVKVTITIQDAA